MDPKRIKFSLGTTLFRNSPLLMSLSLSKGPSSGHSCLQSDTGVDREMDVSWITVVNVGSGTGPKV